MRCKAFETLIGTVCMPLNANVDLWFIFYFLIFSVSCLPQSFDVRMPSFISHYWIPPLWWVNDATVGALLKCFAPIVVGRVQTHILWCAYGWTYLVFLHVWLCLWYGPRVCNKRIIIMIFTDKCINNSKWIIYKHNFSALLLTLNVPLQISKCTARGTCTPVWEHLI